MKRHIIFGSILITLACSCNLTGTGSANGFEETLRQAPFTSITDSIGKNPSDPALLLRRATLLSQNNQHDIAYYDYKKSWQLHPSEETALLYISNLFLTGRGKDAVELLKKCIQTYPANLEFNRRLGEAYTQAGNTRAALDLYDDMIKKDSSNFEALYEKGMLYAQLKDTANAIVLLEKAWHRQMA